MTVVNGELEIYFTYELMPKATKQKDLMAKAYSVLKPLIESDDRYKDWRELLMNAVKADRSIMDITWLQKHLNDYTAKNSFDYFIHKNLGGFLRRELDFYIKNEVLVIDDLTSAKMKSTLAIVKAIEQVGNKIITFLAQLEDFQKKLWLKKKFVVGCDYCITLDRIPESMYSEIIANEEQRKEWVRLFAIDEIKGDLTTEAYSEPLTIEFLKQNPFLVLDTKFFSLEFKHKLLASMENIDEQCNGLLIKSENFQGLNLIQKKYKDGIDCVFIDPPFNLGENADFLYRVDYKDSTWCVLLENRIDLNKPLFSKDGYIFVRCSHDGNMYVRLLLENEMGRNNYRNEIILRRAEETKGDLNKQFDSLKSITVNYDNLYWFSRTPDCRFNKITKPISEEKAPSHWHSFWKAQDRKNMRYELLGLDLTKHYGQWMWEKNRAYAAVDNYKKYLAVFEKTGISLDDYYEQTGRKLEFIRRDGKGYSSIKYWIPKRSFTMADTNWLDIKGYANKWGFKTENSEKVLYRIINSLTDCKSVVMDYFLGSGTTTAVAQKLDRRWIGMEMGDQFENFIMPRMKYVLNGEQSGISDQTSYKGGGCFKYIRLEQYEDTLNNLIPKPSMPSNDDEFQESYMLGYMLDTDTRGSLLNLKMFKHPFDVKIKTTKDNELVDTPVDMVETFNYLIGLNVETESWHHGGDICVVEGKTHIGNENTLVIWRDCEKINNDALNEFFRKQDFNTLDMEYDVIYVNGDNTLPNVRRDEDHWKVVLTEDEFKARMFEED